MKRSGLKASQIDEFLSVLMNERQMDFNSGAIRVKGLSRATFDFMKRDGYLTRGADGRYYPDFCRSNTYPIFSPTWQWLPIDVIWHVVEPMLRDGSAGYSVTADKRWALLNLFSRGQRGYTDANEEEICRILGELSAYGYIWFQFGGSVWCIEKRKDEYAAQVAA